MMTIVERFLLDSSFFEQPKFGQVRLGRNRVKRRVKILEIRHLAYCLSIMKRWSRNVLASFVDSVLCGNCYESEIKVLNF